MMKRIFLTIIGVLFLFSFLTEPAVAGAIGKVVALRGTTIVERGGQEIAAKVNLDLEVSDAIRTAESAKIKLLFTDGSILTLGANTHLLVKEFIDGKGERGKSLFNLLDGKMRSVVGHTRFEVATPTAVAAARGTVIYFDVSSLNSQPMTTIICLEGVIDVTSLLAGVSGGTVLTAGNMVIVKTGEPIVPVSAPAALLEASGNLSSGNSEGEGSDGSGQEGDSGPTGTPGEEESGTNVDGPADADLPLGSGDSVIPTLPPINQEPLQPTRVNIKIDIPTLPH